jgi:TolA-binding protein
MTRHFRWLMLGAVACVLIAAGCETTGGNQMQTTVYDTHRRMVKLDKELEDSVGRLNESTATLLARVDESDQQTRTLRGLIEENQQKLDTLNQELRDMRTTLYRHWGLTVSGGAAAAPVRDVVPGQVTVEGPVTLQQQPVQTPAQTPARNELLDSAPVPTEPAVAAAAAPPIETPAVSDAAATEPPLAEATAAPAAAGQGDPQALYQEAQRSYSRDDFASALNQFDAYLSNHLNEDENLSANAQFWKAKCLMNMEKYAESVQAFEGLRSNFPTSTKVPFAMHNQAVAHSRLGQTAQAERLMEAVIEQFPISPAADQARADLQKLRGN